MPSTTRHWPSKATLIRLAVYLLLAFCFLGSRALWDPDEGRYTNVALNMLESGDWLHPMRSHEAGHWTKPPLTYWSIAASVGSFGYASWAARLPAALSYLACIFLLGRMARRLLPGREVSARLVFASMGLPLLAAGYITTDFLLAATLSLAMTGYIEARFGEPRQQRRWVLLMWAGFGLAFLTKGPPALLPWLAILMMEICGHRARRVRLLTPEGIAAFVLLAFGWFAWVIDEKPGLFGYFLGEEVARRIAGDGFGHFPQWWGWLYVYGLTLLLGSLPWTWRLLRTGRAMPAQLSDWWQQRRAASADIEARALLLLWLLLPLAVLCFAQSRLPLYALPLFVPLALLIAPTAEQLHQQRYRLVLWLLAMLSLRLATALWPTHKNAEDWANLIRQRAPMTVEEVVFVDDMARYGVHLYLQAEVEKVGFAVSDAASIDREFDHDFIGELLEREPGVVYVSKLEQFPTLAAATAKLGQHALQLGEPYRGRVLFVTEPANSCAPVCVENDLGKRDTASAL